jgi:hypothetical protein
MGVVCFVGRLRLLPQLFWKPLKSRLPLRLLQLIGLPQGCMLGCGFADEEALAFEMPSLKPTNDGGIRTAL